MIIAQINTVNGGSTGNIMHEVADIARSEGHTVYTFSARIYRKGLKTEYRPIKDHFYYGNEAGSFFHKCAGRLTGLNGFFSFFSTARLIAKLKKLHVETVHLHNLHDFCINLPLLFRFIKRNDIKVIWTLHDCWSLTGHCPHYGEAKCERWKTGCGKCPQLMVNPRSYIDTTRWMWKCKKRLFCGVRDMTIVTPSKWLAEQVKQSYLKEYPVRVINNGIDVSVFRRTGSDFRKDHGCEGKFVILDVASCWEHRKGLDVFVDLAKRLDDSYQIVLVGTDDGIDRILPENILSIHRTADRHELAQIYSAADLLVNPTREDTYPTVNMEAIACGTPVLTYRTGGSPEILDEDTGSVVECDDFEGLLGEIVRIREEKPFSRKKCCERGAGFDKHERFRSYLELYE